MKQWYGKSSTVSCSKSCPEQSEKLFPCGSDFILFKAENFSRTVHNQPDAHLEKVLQFIGSVKAGVVQSLPQERYLETNNGEQVKHEHVGFDKH